MIVDSSALIAIALKEQDSASLRVRLSEADILKMSAASLLETIMVVYGRVGLQGVLLIEELVVVFGILIFPFNESQAKISIDAFFRYGKGQGHPAQLNFGDLMAYALAKQTGEPLLFKGDDFTHTDLLLA